MIVGIGVDIISIERVKHKVERNKDFQSAVFSDIEKEYCDKQTNPHASYAGKFAAKEAFLKALGTGIDLSFELNTLEVLNDTYGKPYFKYSHFIQQKLISKFSLEPTLHVSISHSHTDAVAYVVMEVVPKSRNEQF